MWLITPILAALVLVLILIPKTAPLPLEAARARWDARPFTNYRMMAIYNDGSVGCVQDISVKGDEVVAIHNSRLCTTPFPNIAYPTMSDIFNYLEAQNQELEVYSGCESEACQCNLPIGTLVTYTSLGYPRYIQVRPLFDEPLGSRFIFATVPCSFMNRVQSSIQIARVTPE